ncbi:hypothetical protein CEXT_593111 [Caerostris extrusa]|uniref:Uncharacterized protein n=1 Tax=Caerostris extrusa TaxID=172846 RepID=A0AAV4N9R4_CAEEX|nr:hypothetical protein CEXT_593111 [Caerostris extrusa]
MFTFENSASNLVGQLNFPNCGGTLAQQPWDATMAYRITCITRSPTKSDRRVTCNKSTDQMVRALPLPYDFPKSPFFKQTEASGLLSLPNRNGRVREF